MAKFSTKLTLFFNLALLLSFLLVASVVESRSVLGGRAAASTPECDSVYGVASTDTCLAVAQQFNLTNDEFNAINPNLNCDKLFVGQWLCIAGTSN